MKKTIEEIGLFLWMITAMLVGCQEQKHEQGNATIVPEITHIKIVETYQDCDIDSARCTYASIAYPQFTDSTQRACNEVLRKQIALLTSGLDSADIKLQSIEVIARDFVRDYQQFMLDFPDYEVGWYLEAESKITYLSGKVVSFQVNNSSYTGGAHPNTTKNLFVMDRLSGRILRTADIVTDTLTFKAMLEGAFRDQLGIEPGQSMADAGYYLEDGDFLLNDNIGLNDTAIFVHFNPYEIAPYSRGDVTIWLEKEALDGMLTIE
jgi:hypothetical protein